MTIANIIKILIMRNLFILIFCTFLINAIAQPSSYLTEQNMCY